MNPFQPQRVSFNFGSDAPRTVDPGKVAAAIKNNETGGVKDPYSFRQKSGAGDYANGAYQVRDSELKTYSPRYLGRQVSPQEFLSSPQMQDNYMNVKATSLAGRGLSAEQIMAAHRGGGSDLTSPALASLVSAHQGYVNKGMQFYGQPAAPADQGRSLQDLTAMR